MVAVSPGFTKTNLNNYAGTETVEQGAHNALEVGSTPSRPILCWKRMDVGDLLDNVGFDCQRDGTECQRFFTPAVASDKMLPHRM